jgi:hypothetical protein
MGSFSIWEWLLVGVVIVLIADTVRRVIRGSRLKRCPFCAELVRSEAIVCKHCGRDIQPHKS